MKGSVFYKKDRGQWVVGFYWQGRSRTIHRYKGEFMYGKRIADKCLAMIQSRYEQYKQGLCHFKIEEFTGKGYTDINEFFEEWMKLVIEPNKKPATIKGYWSYYRNWIKPFFEKNSIMLHEIQLDSLTKLKNSITLSGKGQYNVMNCFHSMMDYAERSKRIPSVPSFPKKNEYDLNQPDFKWVHEDEQMKIINEINPENRPIFLFLKYHYRRPSEACALQWQDYDEINRVFTIRRTISAEVLVTSTKSRAIHYIPCDQDFLPIISSLKKNRIGLEDEFIFKNPRARKEGKRYSDGSLNNLWKNACKKVGIDIPLYHGTKHSSCSQFINDKEGTMDELQMLTDHKRRDSVEHYAKLGMDRKRKLMQRGKVVQLKERKSANEK